jgi:integrase
MKARRDHGDHNIEKRGDKYQVRVSLGFHPVTGKRIRKALLADTRAEARKKADHYREQFNRGIDIDGGQELLSVYLDKWFETFLSKRHLRESSEQRYRDYLKRINQTLGDVPISMITPLHLDQLVREHRSLKSLYKVYGFLKTSFEDAIKYDVIATSPFWKHDAPRKVPREEVVFLDEKEIGQLITQLQGEWVAEMMIFGLNTGCRAGELIGAEWDDLERKEDGSGSVTIRRSVRTNTRGEYVVNAPKTVRGYRTIELSAQIMEVLDRKREKNNARKIVAHYWNDLGDTLIFPNRVGGYHSGSNILKELKRVSADAGIEKAINLKTLRHTSATLAIKNGMDLHTLKNRMGHKDISVTSNTYGHHYPGQQAPAATMLDKYLVE